jgi:hypothetical protein
MKYWTTVVNGKGAERKRKDILICQQDGEHKAEKKADGTWVFSNAVLAIRDRLMLTENDKQHAFHRTPVQETRLTIHTVAGFGRMPICRGRSMSLGVRRSKHTPASGRLISRLTSDKRHFLVTVPCKPADI